MFRSQQIIQRTVTLRMTERLKMRMHVCVVYSKAFSVVWGLGIAETSQTTRDQQKNKLSLYQNNGSVLSVYVTLTGTGSSAYFLAYISFTQTALTHGLRQVLLVLTDTIKAAHTMISVL